MERDRDGQRLLTHERRLRLLVLHLSSRALRGRVEPDDVVQEVFLRTIARPAELPDDDAELWRLLAHIARNTVVDVARAARAAKRSGDRVERLARSDWTRGVDPAARTAGPRTRVALGELQRTLERAFDALDPEHRRVIGLRQFEGLSAREAARRMGRTETAVHSLYRRALMAWDAALPDDS